MIEFISSIFGVIFRVIYSILGNNYALSIIIFTIITKLIMFPLTYKQQKSMKEMQKVGPLETKIREKYKNNPQKMNDEIMKLYSQHKINPVAGCLPMLIQLPIILGMYWIVKQPLTYIKQMPMEQIRPYAVEYYEEQLKSQGKSEQDIEKALKKFTDKQVKMYELDIADKENLIDMNFLGIDLGKIPSKSTKTAPYLLIIPALSLIVSLISNKRMMKKSTLTPEQLEQQKSMMMMGPIMSTYLSFIMPAALGLYWLLGSIIGLLQQIYLDYKFNPTPKHELLNSGGKK